MPLKQPKVSLYLNILNKTYLGASDLISPKELKMQLFVGSSPEVLKMVCFLALFSFIGLTDAGQERVKLLNILTNPTPGVLESWPHAGSSVAVSVDYQHLDDVSSSVLMAESWLRAHVLSHFPAVQITTIVAGNAVLCNNEFENKWDLVLPSARNIYHSLVRWGLEKDIKVSVALSTECLHPFSYSYRDDLAQRVIKPLLNFLQNTNSSFSVLAPSDFGPLVAAHRESVKKLGFFQLSEINVVLVTSSKDTKPRSRKLSHLDPFPARPTPLTETSQSPLHSSIGFSVPANVANSPLPPLVQTPPAPLSPLSSPPSPSMSFPYAPEATLPPSMSFSFPPQPQSPPLVIPSNPPDALSYPPCYAPTPRAEEKGLWCVAKPSVPEEKLKEAMDYACGAGGADCEEIGPHGSCYNPDTMVAHASYAYNSYWQKNKKNGGTCDFGGTAMVINVNPSFQHCMFTLSS